MLDTLSLIYPILTTLTVVTAKGVYLDLFADNDETIYLYDAKGNNFVDVEFNPTNSVFDTARLTNVIYPDELKLTYYDNDEDYKDIIARAKETTVECLTITRQRNRNIHYAV